MRALVLAVSLLVCSVASAKSKVPGASKFGGNGGGGSGLPLSGGTMTGPITFSGTQLGTYTLGGVPTYTLSSALNLLQTKSVRMTLANTTAAVTGGSGMQYSPALKFGGTGFVSGASELNEIVIYNRVSADQGGNDGSEGQLAIDFLNGGASAGSIPKFRIWNALASAGIFLLSGASKSLWLGANTDAAGNISGAYEILSTGPTITWGVSGANKLRLNATDLYPMTSGVALGATTQFLSVRAGGAVGSRPTCDEALRSTFFNLEAAGGASDVVQVCSKSAADSYAWRDVFTAP